MDELHDKDLLMILDCTFDEQSLCVLQGFFGDKQNIEQVE
jgi:hypothetical protein